MSDNHIPFCDLESIIITKFHFAWIRDGRQTAANPLVKLLAFSEWKMIPTETFLPSVYIIKQSITLEEKISPLK